MIDDDSSIWVIAPAPCCCPCECRSKMTRAVSRLPNRLSKRVIGLTLTPGALQTSHAGLALARTRINLRQCTANYHLS
jgi:hypothetical protein